MFILDKPFVSEFLLRTIRENNFPVLKNEAAIKLGLENFNNLLNETETIEFVKQNLDAVVYTNSENSISWIQKNLHFGFLPKAINLFKDKGLFRDFTNYLFPDFFYKVVSINDLKHISYDSLPKPFVIKPNVGFFSLGVYRIENESDWQFAVESIFEELKTPNSIYPKEVLNTEKFIIEQYIDGEEYAFDAYFDSKGNAVILSVMKHLFSSNADVSDRVYLTSQNIVKENLLKFETFLDEINKDKLLRNFPLHTEVRISSSGEVFPIEVNPLRFGGWCTTADFAIHAYGLNSYKNVINQVKPNWETVFKGMGNKLYSLIVLNNSTGISVDRIKYFNYEKLLSKFENPLELRKVNHKKFGVFGFLFSETSANNFIEIENILKSNLTEFIEIG